MNVTPADKFKILSDTFPNPLECDLVRQKGIYPYEHMKTFESFQELELPAKEAFHSSLTGKDITDAEYAHAQRVWSTFLCEDMGDYHDLYLKTDVLLLADVFENFRKTAYDTYGLDPANYLTLPGLAWDALLKLTKVSLDEISDIDVYNFIEHGKWGGISMASNRWTVANNHYL